MKAILLILSIIHVCSSQPGYQEIILKNEKRLNFGKYIVITGSCDKGSAIKILYSGESVYKYFGGDGKYDEIDTMDINKDKKLDFVFSYSFDEYSTLGMIVSTGKKKKYEIISLQDDIFRDPNCSVEPYQINDERLKDFVLFDIDNDGYKDILTIAIQNPDRSVTPTGCSMTILHQRLLQILNIH